MKEFKELYKTYKCDRKKMRQMEEDMRFADAREYIESCSDVERWKFKAILKSKIADLHTAETGIGIFAAMITIIYITLKNNTFMSLMICVCLVGFMLILKVLNKRPAYVYLLSMLEEYETRQEEQQIQQDKSRIPSDI